jgi:hypothetical protein
MRTREIPAGEWPRFLDRLAREHRAWVATVDRGGEVEAEDEPLESISAERGIEIRVGAKAICVERPRALHVEETDHGAVQALEVEDEAGSRVRLRFRVAEPPGALDGLAPIERGTQRPKG